jgi:nucleoside-diphosphate kinase
MSSMERTCILAKPDAVCKNLVGTVFERLAQGGLQLQAAKMLRLSRAQAEEFYHEHRGKPFYEPLVHFMTSAPIVASVWKGAGAVARSREILGGTNSPEAAEGTLRREFGVNNRYNVAHGSDSAASAEREIPFFFKANELYSYDENDWRI